MKTVNILLVEDNDGDILLTTEAFEESKIINNISITKNGKDALDFMFKRGEYTMVDAPDLVLLDINLPLKSGHEVLQILKDSEETKHIPIIMLTTSSTEKDISLSYKHHANCYITKPIEISEFMNAIATIEQFWLKIVKLPPKSI